jgi:peptidoglycan/LPS O-acetylase OafA/YrhL
MTPARAAEVVTRWVRHYTRWVPAPIAERRIDEIRADLHDHIAHERAQGTSDRLIVLSILSRMLRGLPADVRWRGRNRPRRAKIMKTLVIALAMVTVGVAAMVYGGNDDSPGLVLIGLLIVIAAVVLVARAAYRRRRGAGAGSR